MAENLEQRATSKKVGALGGLWPFIRPYRGMVIVAGLALCLTATVSLVLPMAVRRVVDQVCAALPEVAHVEIDMDADPVVARKLSVMSLPTTFIFDAQGKQRYRTAGVPKAADLKAALDPLLA